MINFNKHNFNSSSIVSEKELNEIEDALQSCIQVINNLPDLTIKPTYTASEIGAEEVGTAKRLLEIHNEDMLSHKELFKNTAKKKHCHYANELENIKDINSKIKSLTEQVENLQKHLEELKCTEN